MKVKLVAALSLFLAAVGLILLFAVTPSSSPAPGAPASAAAAPAAQLPGAPAPAAAAPSTAEQAVAVFEKEMREAATPTMVESLYADDTRLRKMTKQDFENARQLYARFLDQLAPIRTARYHVETYGISEDGSRRLQLVEDVVWAPPKERLEETRYQNGREIDKTVTISDGNAFTEWKGGRARSGEIRAWGSPAVRYLHAVEAMLLHDPTARFWGPHGCCELDDGTAGFSRLRDGVEREERFDTPTGLLTQKRFWHNRSTTGSIETYTWRKIGDIWFPHETCRAIWMELPDNVRRKQKTLKIFSDVILNEPVEGDLFSRE